MVLSKLRPQVQRSLSVLARRLGGRIRADYITMASPLLALFIPLSIYYEHLLLSVIILLIAGFLDILDGAVARETGTARPAGAFLDSMMDRFVDTIYYASLILAGYNALIVTLSLGFTITITYSKARAASLGRPIEHRLLERSDRIIVIAILLIIADIASFYVMNTVMLAYMLALFIAALYAVVVGVKTLDKA
ncbi:MAG: CDP-alcohol phosphatidyltransferase family protein [Desulfurococcales archaeon]|nr:CDP-alcohol phosphatidyltransferase family protein [Desulfurococcales archaeon]